jgi:hypothetical protein
VEVPGRINQLPELPTLPKVPEFGISDHARSPDHRITRFRISVISVNQR